MYTHIHTLYTYIYIYMYIVSMYIYIYIHTYTFTYTYITHIYIYTQSGIYVAHTPFVNSQEVEQKLAQLSPRGSPPGCAVVFWGVPAMTDRMGPQFVG